MLGAGLAVAAVRAAAGGGRSRPGSPVPRLARLAASQDGSAMVEFALAAPVLLLLVLVTLQLAAVAVARRAVEGAAFAAARSAAVWVPAETGEGANQLRLTGPSDKRERIERAAALALLAAAPPEDAPASRPEPDVAAALGALARETGLETSGDLAHRYAAARSRTHVAVASAASTPGESVLAGADDPLAVSVTYDCPLRVPLAARLLGRPEPGGGRFQAPLTARCTLRNEGGRESPLVMPEEGR